MGLSFLTNILDDLPLLETVSTLEMVGEFFLFLANGLRSEILK